MMDGDLAFVSSPYSTLLGMASFLGFLLLARRELAAWFRGRVGAIQAAVMPSGDHLTRVAGLLFLGVGLSDVVFVLYHKVQIMEVNSVAFYLMLYFFFVMLPGILAGMFASWWIDPTGAARQGSMLGRIVTGIIFFLALLTIIEFTDYDLLLFAFGPAVMLLIYAFSPLETAK